MPHHGALPLREAVQAEFDAAVVRFRADAAVPGPDLIDRRGRSPGQQSGVGGDAPAAELLQQPCPGRIAVGAGKVVAVHTRRNPRLDEGPYDGARRFDADYQVRAAGRSQSGEIHSVRLSGGGCDNDHLFVIDGVGETGAVQSLNRHRHVAQGVDGGAGERPLTQHGHRRRQPGGVGGHEALPTQMCAQPARLCHAQSRDAVRELSGGERFPEQFDGIGNGARCRVQHEGVGVQSELQRAGGAPQDGDRSAKPERNLGCTAHAGQPVLLRPGRTRDEWRATTLSPGWSTPSEVFSD